MSDEAQWFSDIEKESANDPEIIVYGMLLEITEDICEAMDEQGITRSELSNRLGVSRQYVTNFLNTPTNTTLKSIVQFAQAVGLEVSLECRHTAPMDQKFDPEVWEQPPHPSVFAGTELRRTALPKHYPSERHKYDTNTPVAA